MFLLIAPNHGIAIFLGLSLIMPWNKHNVTTEGEGNVWSESKRRI